MVNPGIVVGAALGMGGLVASFLVQRRIDAALAELSEAEARACDMAGRHALFGVVASMIIFFLVPAGPLGLSLTVGALCANATVLFVRRRAYAALRGPALLAWLSSLAMFGGGALFLVSGGRVRF